MADWKNRIVGYDVKPASWFLANPNNWRLHPKNQQAALKGGLDEIGWIDDVIVNINTNNVIDGHLRVTLALREGDETPIPVKYVDLDENEERFALLTLDPIAAMAASDKEKLDELLRGVQTGEAALQEMLSELAEREGLDYGQQERTDDPGPQIDRAAELQEKWQTETGQLWRLGEHRVICGDCTDAEVVGRVISSERVDCTVTDPPYGIGVNYDLFDDTKTNIKDLIKKIMPIIMNYLPAALTPGIPAIWDYPRPSWLGSWVHPAASGSCPWGFAANNPIIFYGADPYLKIGKGRRADSVIMASDRNGIEGHPVPKPLKVWEWLVERLTPDELCIVFDPFLGSGTTLIACERLNRKCRGIEISPAYVAVTLQRWADMTGQEPELLATGATV